MGHYMIITTKGTKQKGVETLFVKVVTEAVFAVDIINTHAMKTCLAMKEIETHNRLSYFTKD